jgi:hypothetical protein
MQGDLLDVYGMSVEVEVTGHFEGGAFLFAEIDGVSYRGMVWDSDVPQTVTRLSAPNPRPEENRQSLDEQKQSELSNMDDEKQLLL